MNLLTPRTAPVRCAAWALTLAFVLVPALFALAMACFPPGHAGAATGYSFSKHVMSDLGRTRLSNGAPNTLSCALFAAAMTVTGLACALFWLARHTFLSHPAFRRAALTCGLTMSVLMAAIGFTPLNLVAALHDPLTAATAVATALAVLALFTDPSDSLDTPSAKRAWLALMLTVSALWTVLVVAHHERLLAFRPWLPLGQKALIATFIAWMARQTALLFKVKA